MTLIDRSRPRFLRPQHPSGQSFRTRLGILMIVASILPLFFDAAAQAQEEAGAVYVVQITGTIDLGLAPYLKRIVDEAGDNAAAAILLDIDTPGGRLDAVLQMRDTLLASDVPIIAFVDRTAFSAGALVAIAANEIYMTPGAVMGAATPVDGGSGETASAKIVSAVRATFKSTAEARGRNPLVAEAMVDENVVIEGLVGAGELLTLTTTQAVEWGYADGVVSTQSELLQAVGLSGAPLVQTSMGLAERAARFITDPIIASLLMILGLLLIVGDFLVEGVGFPALVGALLIGIFFWGHLVAGLAGWEDLALVGLGIALIAVELFVIPGFGVAGVLGLGAMLGGLFLAVVSRDIRTPEQTERGIAMVAVTFIAVVAGFIALLVLIPHGRRMGGLVLRASVAVPDPRTKVRSGSKWLNAFGANSRVDDVVRPAPIAATQRTVIPSGQIGTAVTELRPSGTANIGGHQVDVVTDGDFVDAGDRIIVVRDEGYRCLVQRVAS